MKYSTWIKNSIGFPKGGEHRINELMLSFVAFSMLIVMGLMVREPEIPDWEVSSFELINQLPNFLFYILWPFMQYGVFVTIPFVAAVAFYYKRYKLATLLLIGGVGIYYIARYIKETVPRGRPGDLLENVVKHEKFAPGSKGFTSGHTAVAATIATFSHFYLSKKWQIASIVTLVIVCIGRIYVGAHLPLDVLGGVALGVGVASLINFIVGVPIPKEQKLEDTKAWIKQHRPRHPGDIVRIFIALLIMTSATVVAITGTVRPLEEAVFRVINLLPSALGPAVRLIMQFGALYFVFIATAIALATKHNRLSIKILFGGVGTWLITKVAKAMVDRERPAYLLEEIVERASSGGLLGFPSGHSAVAAVIATLAWPYLPKRWGRLLWTAAWITALGRVFVGAHLPLDIFAGLALGWFIGSILNVGFGTPAKPWPKEDIMETLRNAGLKIKKLVGAEVDARGSTPIFAKTDDGQEIFIKLVDTEHRNADILYRLWRFITFRDIQDEAPFASAKQQAEHEAYLSIQAANAGVRSPKVLLASPVSRSAAIIATERVNGTVLTEFEGKFSRRLLTDVWLEVNKLHEQRIAHRDLRAANILIDEQRQPWIIDYSFSQTAASDEQLSRDIVELVTTLSLITNYEMVVDTAHEVFGEAKIKKMMPFLQARALSNYSKKRLQNEPELLNQIKDRFKQLTDVRHITYAQMARFNFKWIWLLLIVGATIYYFAPRLDEFDQSVDAVKQAKLLPLFGVLMASLMTYIMSAYVVMGAARSKLQFWKTFILQFATTTINRITPRGVGGAVLIEQYLERHRHSRVEATASVSVIYAVGAVVHVLLTLTVIAIDDPDLFEQIELSASQIFLIIIGGLLVLSGALFVPRIKEFVKRWGKETVNTLRDISQNWRRSLLLIGGSIGVTLSYAIGFGFAVNALGGDIGMEQAIFVYLAGNILAASAPTPGGLGATEAVLSVGLSLSGVPVGPAVTSVLVFRLITFWLPIIPGLFAIRYMRKRKYI